MSLPVLSVENPSKNWLFGRIVDRIFSRMFPERPGNQDPKPRRNGRKSRIPRPGGPPGDPVEAWTLRLGMKVALSWNRRSRLRATFRYFSGFAADGFPGLYLPIGAYWI